MPQDAGSARAYDVCLSFAGEDRVYVEQVAAALVERGITVFYDAYEKSRLWGKDLYQHLAEVYTDRARYCIIFVSEHYAAKLWTSHELRSAQARAFESVDQEYILPARFDGTDIPGLFSTTAYVDLADIEPETLADMVADKLEEPERLQLGEQDKSVAELDAIAVEYGEARVASLYGFALPPASELIDDLARRCVDRLYGAAIHERDHTWWTQPPDRQFDRVYVTSGVVETTAVMGTQGAGEHLVSAVRYLKSVDLTSVDNRAAVFTLLGINDFPADSAAAFIVNLSTLQRTGGEADDGSFLLPQGPMGVSDGVPSQWTGQLHVGAQAFHACHLSELLMRMANRHGFMQSQAQAILTGLRRYLVNNLKHNDGWLLDVNRNRSDMTLYAYAMLPALRVPLPRNWLENTRMIYSDIMASRAASIAGCRTFTNSFLLARLRLSSAFARQASAYANEELPALVSWLMSERPIAELAFGMRALLYGLELSHAPLAQSYRESVCRRNWELTQDGVRNDES
jgi:hypothetical protein